MEPILKRGRWCVTVKGRNFKFNTEQEAIDMLGGDKLVEEVITEDLGIEKEDEPSQREFNWKPWEK